MTPLEQAFNSFLLTMPPHRLESLLKYLNEARAHENDPNPAVDGAAMNSPFSAARRPTLPTPAAPRSPALRGKRFRAGKLRPLNSFIAFRSFYSNIFPELTQKAKSGILKFLWQNDPCKAKWAILAKAYSIIRDDHVGEVSLDSFLSLNMSYLGIIEPDRYLDAMGWELSVDGQSQYTMTRVKSTVTAETEVSTLHSADDIVTRCYEMGYVSEERRSHKSSHNGDGPVTNMAFVAHPTLVVNENDRIRISGTDNSVVGDMGTKPNIQVSSSNSLADTPSPGPIDMSVMTGDVFGQEPDVPTVQPCFNSQPKAENDFNVDMQFANAHGAPFFLPFDAMEMPMMDYDPLITGPLENYGIDRWRNF